MAKRPAERYVPANIPDTLPALVQFLYDELWRISRALNEFPVGLNVTEDQAGISVDTTPQETRLFEGVDPTLDLPGGDWNNPLGEWTVPLTGLYQININAVVAPFGSGNKDYAAKIVLYVNDVETWANTDVGNDQFPLSCTLSVSGLLSISDVVRITIVLQHEQFTGVTSVNAFMTTAITAAKD